MAVATTNIKTRYNRETKTWSGPLERPDYIKIKYRSCGEKILKGLLDGPDKIGQICLDNGVKLTRNELRLQSIRVAQHLHGFGYRKDDIVMIISRNNHKLAPVIYGSLMAGLQITPVDLGLEIDELNHVIKLARPKLIILEYDILRAVENILIRNDIAIDLFIFDKSVVNYKHVDCLLQRTGRENHFKLIDIDDPVSSVAFIIWSSGTTGLNKGVRLSHAHFTNKPCDLDTTTLYTSSSTSWMSGVTTYLMVAFYTALHVVTRQKCPPGLISKLCPDYISLLIGSHADKINLEKYVPTEPGDGYTFTEFGNTIARPYTYRKGSVGFLSESVQVRIHSDDGELCGINEIGELHVRPNLPFLGYINKGVVGDVLDTDGWIKSGDLCYFDEDGYLYIVGRKSDVLVHSERLIYPNNIEQLLMQHGSIKDVAIVGIDKCFSESQLVACVITSPGTVLNERDVIEFLEGKIEDFQIPRGGVYFMNEFPKTVSGNIKRRQLKEKLVKMLSGSNSR